MRDLARPAIAISIFFALLAVAFPVMVGTQSQAMIGVTGKPLAQMTTTTTVTCTFNTGPEFLCKAVIQNDQLTGGFSGGSVSWTTSGNGSFSPSSTCTVDEESASTSTCSVYYIPSATDSQVTITASYSGDPENQPSSGSVSFNAAQTSATSSTVTQTSQTQTATTSQQFQTSSTVASTTSSSVSSNSASNLGLYVGIIVAIVIVALLVVFVRMRGRSK